MTELYKRSGVIPGHSCTRSKAPDRFLRTWADRPRFSSIETDADGVARIDMQCALGARSLGYESSPPPAWGVSSLPLKWEIDAAEAVLAHVSPWASHIRFVKTGSAATSGAYRVAKRATGRPHVLMGDWAYHGNDEWCDDPKFPWTFRYPHNCDFKGWRTDDIAAIFIEPHRWEPVDEGWLRHVRQFCDRIGALMVMDEMIWGGRMALSGATGHYGITPDMAAYGKAFGNGQSVSWLVGGPALTEHGELMSGTFSGEGNGLQAVCDTLQVYTTEPVIDTLWTRGRQLQVGLRRVVPAEIGVVEGQPVHQRIRFTNPAHHEVFRYAMAERGVLMLPDAINVMYAHTEGQIDQVIEAVRASVQELR